MYENFPLFKLPPTVSMFLLYKIVVINIIITANQGNFLKQGFSMPYWLPWNLLCRLGWSNYFSVAVF